MNKPIKSLKFPGLSDTYIIESGGEFIKEVDGLDSDNIFELESGTYKNIGDYFNFFNNDLLGSGGSVGTLYSDTIFTLLKNPYEVEGEGYIAVKLFDLNQNKIYYGSLSVQEGIGYWYTDAISPVDLTSIYCDGMSEEDVLNLLFNLIAYNGIYIMPGNLIITTIDGKEYDISNLTANASWDFYGDILTLDFGTFRLYCNANGEEGIEWVAEIFFTSQRLPLMEQNELIGYTPGAYVFHPEQTITINNMEYDVSNQTVNISYENGYTKINLSDIIFLVDDEENWKTIPIMYTIKSNQLTSDYDFYKLYSGNYMLEEPYQLLINGEELYSLQPNTVLTIRIGDDGEGNIECKIYNGDSRFSSFLDGGHTISYWYKNDIF